MEFSFEKNVKIDKDLFEKAVLEVIEKHYYKKWERYEKKEKAEAELKNMVVTLIENRFPPDSKNNEVVAEIGKDLLIKSLCLSWRYLPFEVLNTMSLLSIEKDTELNPSKFNDKKDDRENFENDSSNFLVSLDLLRECVLNLKKLQGHERLIKKIEELLTIYE